MAIELKTSKCRLGLIAKKAKANISAKEKLALKELAKEFLGLSQDELYQLVDDGELLIVGDDDE